MINKLGKGLQDVISREMAKATLAARNDNVILNRSVRDKLTRRGMKFNDVDKNSFTQKLVVEWSG